MCVDVNYDTTWISMDVAEEKENIILGLLKAIHIITFTK